MAISNKDRISRAQDLLREGLTPFVEQHLKAAWDANWDSRLDQSRPHPIRRDRDGKIHWDTQELLKTVFFNWRDVFSGALGEIERTYVSEWRNVRNDFAHEKPFSSDDTIRALDTAERLLTAISSDRLAQDVKTSRLDLQRTVYSEQARTQTRRKTLTLEGAPKAGLKPWREIVIPHEDVASGRYQQAEFAADLAQVHRGEGAPEYLNPVEFYSRTYITEGLKHLLEGAMLRLSGKGGDPVVELQTNFGGGKTHSMLALYHLFGTGSGGDGSATSLPGIEALMTGIGVDRLPQAQRAVLVGTAMSPGQPHEKEDGTITRTLWGEMAWQLGGAEGYAMVAESDTAGTSPGSALLAELLNAYSPCLVLIDEWVAYVRQLYHVTNMPAGSFDANLTFAQALTEAVKVADRALVVASLPASQIEIGGEGGAQALERLKNTFSRLESSWRPATADEGFEIVRRRLFQPITGKDDFAARDAAIRAFSEMYRGGSGEFPSGCGEAEYKRRMEAAYPIHPELFDRLYNDWGSLDKFQRTRGVLRLMASVIHALWERDDRSLMILPASIPIDNSGVQFELVRYLDPSWDAVIAKDIDGGTSAPLTIDQEVPTLGRYSATRRVARTIYMGSAPTYQGKNPGIDERRIRLGCAQPGEAVPTFGDALRRLANRATFLYVDGTRYWYSTQPSVSRLADDRAAQQDIHDVWAKLIGVLRDDLDRGEFAGVHVAPDSLADVPDEMEARLVVVSPEYPHTARSTDSRTIKGAEEILANRGSGQRIYKNMLVFLGPDKQRLPELEQAMRLWIAWSSIVKDNEALNLDAFQRRQAETKQAEMKETVQARIKETWIWALTPSQPDSRNPKIEWGESRLQGQDALAVRASKKLVQEESLMVRMGPARLKLVLDNHLWTDQNHLGTKQLWEYLASYLYLPRLRDSGVLASAIQGGISELVCDAIAYAGRFDEATGRYEGLKMTGGGSVELDSLSVVVKPEIAKAQVDAEQPIPGPGPTPGEKPDDGAGAGPDSEPDAKPEAELPRRFFGTVDADPDRLGRDAGKIAEEVLQHLSTIPGSKIRVTIEIEAEVQNGVVDDVQRVINENCQTLRFRSHGFEKS